MAALDYKYLTKNTKEGTLDKAGYQEVMWVKELTWVIMSDNY
jgi:hypothetical protein